MSDAIERAVLRVTNAATLSRRAGGMSVLERQLFTARRGGLSVVYVDSTAPLNQDSLRVPPGLSVRWKNAPRTPPLETPYLEISGDHLVKPSVIAEAAKRAAAGPVRFADATGAIVVASQPSQDDVLTTLSGDRCFPLRSEPKRRIVSWLMTAGPKSQDGFMARVFDRRISMSVSRVLLDSAVTPNMMTIFSTFLGLIGASFFLGTSRRWYIPGALLIWLHSVLDGCDGELARVRFEESAFGSDLDFWGDNLVHVALFTCLGWGFWRDGNGVHTLVLAALADMGAIASAWSAWRHRLSKRRGAAVAPEAGVADEIAGHDFESKLARLENQLAQRDFIYLLVALAFVDCVYEFLWAAAIGGLLYFAIMMYLRRAQSHEQALSPNPAR